MFDFPEVMTNNSSENAFDFDISIKKRFINIYIHINSIFHPHFAQKSLHINHTFFVSNSGIFVVVVSFFHLSEAVRECSHEELSGIGHVSSSPKEQSQRGRGQPLSQQSHSSVFSALNPFNPTDSSRVLN